MREHDFIGEFGKCRGCGKYVEELMEERYCSMSTQTENKYANADTSPERLTEIEKMRWAMFAPQDLADLGEYIARREQPNNYLVMISDLLAMLHENAELMLEGGKEIDRLRELCDHSDAMVQDYAQQLHDQRWRRQSVDGMPELELPVQIRLNGILDHARLQKGYMGALWYQSQRGERWSAELKGYDEIWWRPIPPLPKE